MRNLLKSSSIVLYVLLLLLISCNSADSDSTKKRLTNYLKQQKIFLNSSSAYMHTYKNEPYLIFSEVSSQFNENSENFFPNNLADNEYYRKVFKSIIKSGRASIGENSIANKQFYIGLQNIIDNNSNENINDDIAFYIFDNENNTNGSNEHIVKIINTGKKIFVIAKVLRVLRMHPYLAAIRITYECVKIIIVEIRKRIERILQEIDIVKRMIREDRFITILSEIAGNAEYLKSIIANYRNITNKQELSSINSSLESIVRENYKLTKKISSYIRVSLEEFKKINLDDGHKEKKEKVKKHLAELLIYEKCYYLNIQNDCYINMLHLYAGWNRKRFKERFQKINKNVAYLKNIYQNEIKQHIEKIKNSYKIRLRFFGSAEGDKAEIEKLKIDFFKNIEPYNTNINKYIEHFRFLNENDSSFVYFLVKFDNNENVTSIRPIRKKISTQ